MVLLNLWNGGLDLVAFLARGGEFDWNIKLNANYTYQGVELRI